MVPSDGLTKPMSILKSVVLPQPEGPKIDKNSPSLTPKETFLTASFVSYFLERLIISNFMFKLMSPFSK